MQLLASGRAGGRLPSLVPCLLFGLVLGLGACSSTPPPSPPPLPPSSPSAAPFAAEDASRSRIKPGWAFREQAVAAAHPLAADAGLQILRAGGSAVDAAVAVQAVLTLVEPQSSGIGGGALLMHWDGREAQAWDGRETAPAAGDPRAFLRPDGSPVPGGEAVFGGRAVGVPGVLPMLQAVHAEHGRLPWASLFEPAIRLAEDGFALGERLHTLLQSNLHLRREGVVRGD